MLEPPEPDCRLHPALEARPSPIAGTGLFTRDPVAAGTVVIRFGGRLVTWAELQELFAEAARQPDRPYVDTIAVTEAWHLVLPARRTAGYSNHSCDPNLWWTGPYTLAARRDIPAGAEVTSDYATSTADPDFTVDCACGAPGGLCRGTVTGADWRLPELRRRYGDHWTPALLTRIRRTYGETWTPGGA
ncbi:MULTISPECIES: SET domain-containing protein [Streptomyces]|uniref:SET domain-containing protein n=1 Tax=Streptomyces lycii TaxID=2654337 RepID=A0ABQ7FKD8_9ACTN|nr:MULTISPECIES: SET domain-containing protein-lysine N-methyltransferase [Streptomyces]KAF4408809.1 SET domain-containing protein [Streptomyces lycii]